MNGRPYRVALGRYHRVSHASHMTLKASVLGVATYLGNVDHLGGATLQRAMSVSYRR